jgi:tetratricopeptide (TPR) repeat protein
MVTSIAILFLGVGFLLNRLGVFTAFLLALCVGWVPVSRGGRIPAEAWKAWVGPAGCSAVLLLQVWLAFHYEDNAFRRLVEPRSHSTAAPAVPFWFPSDQEEVIRWIQNHTPTGAVFLSSIELSAMVLKDAGRAVNLQPKFELASARKKFERTVKTLFDTKEPEFARMLADYQTTHILWSAQYALDRGPHSYRYIADRLRLPRESLVYRLHFRPDTFGSLRLVFRNRFFLVYEVVGDLSPRPESPSARNDYPVYNEGVFCGGTERNGESFLDDSAAARVVGQARLAHTRIADAWEAWRGGNARSAAALLRDATHGVLPDGDVYLSAARLALELKQPKGAAEYGEAAVRLNSASAEPRVFLARFYMGAGQPDRALKYANEAMALKTEDIDAFLIAAHVRMARKEFRLAAVILEEARRIDPLNLEVMELSQQVRMAR